MIFEKSVLSTVPELVKNHGDPLFVYSSEAIGQQISTMRSVQMPYGYTLRFAMKANPFEPILAYMQSKDVAIDASSSYEAANAIKAGYAPDRIRLTSQQLPHDWQLIADGVLFTACSLHQLTEFAQKFPGKSCGVRINPGEGSGHSVKANVGGPLSSFGIWHEYITEITAITTEHNITINTLHTHIGSGTDPAVWEAVAEQSVQLLEHFPDATVLNLGGGFKVARMENEVSPNVPEILQRIKKQIDNFFRQSGRKIHLELEPGTYLVANAGVLAARIIDIVNTGESGHEFIKLNTGMNDILRPSLYGAQHPIQILNKNTKFKEYIVVGHNCESGDILTTAPGQPEVTQARQLQIASIGDIVLIGGTGAYCASMAAQGYNAYPSAEQIVI